MKNRVLDSWAILEWISGRQPGTDIVRKLFSETEEGRSRLLLMPERFYAFLRKQPSEALALHWR